MVSIAWTDVCICRVSFQKWNCWVKHLCMCGFGRYCPVLYLVVPVYIPNSYVCSRPLFSEWLRYSVVFRLWVSASLIGDRWVHFWSEWTWAPFLIFKDSDLFFYEICSSCLFLNWVVLSSVSERPFYICLCYEFKIFGVYFLSSRFVYCISFF